MDKRYVVVYRTKGTDHKFYPAHNVHVYSEEMAEQLKAHWEQNAPWFEFRVEPRGMSHS